MTQTDTDTRPLLHVELVVWFFGTEFLAGVLDEQLSPAQRKEVRRQYAELLIPFHTDQAKYGFTCYIVGIPNSQPAPVELLILNRHAAQLHKQFADRCRPFPEELSNEPSN